MTEYADLAHTLGSRKRNPYDRKREWGYGLLKQSMSEQPIDHPMQGVARLAQALVGGWTANKADEAEKGDNRKRSAALAAAMAEPDPQKRLAALAVYDPDIGARSAGSWAVKQAELQEQQKVNQAAGDQFGAGWGMNPPAGGANVDRAGGVIGGIESGGKYDAVGPVANAQGNRAFGKYQILDTNIGPWTQEVLGKAMTPQEFLANPQAQDAVFKTKFSQYVQKYGSPQAASRAWFAGPNGMNNPNARDVNGMTVSGYEGKFNAGYGGQQPPPAEPPVQIAGPPQAPPQQAGPPVQGPQPPPQMAPQAPPGQPPAPQPGVVSSPTLVAPQVPDVPRPQPNPATVQRLVQLVRAGKMTPAQADAQINAEVDRDWSVARERAKMEYEQQFEAYKHGRKKGDEPGPFQGNGMEAQARNAIIRATKEPGFAASAEYRAARAYLEQPRQAFDESRGVMVTLPPADLSWAPPATFSAQGQGQGAQPGQAPAGPTVTPVPGLPDKPMNEEQSKSAGFADRMTLNNSVIDELETEGTEFSQRLRDKIPFNAGNFSQSAEYRKFKTAKDNWIAANLRKESGALIGADEYRDADLQYFPQPGDDPAVIAFKAQLRRTATESMKRGAGPSYKPKEPQAKPAAAPPTGGPTRIDINGKPI